MIGEHDLAENQGLKFFGKITASVTHEMNNVLGIIDQVAGLLEDMLAMQSSGGELNPEKLARIHEKITRQTSRGVGIIKNLNTFAHSVDVQLIEFDLNTELDNLVSLSRRFADLKRIDLNTELSPDEIRMLNDPFRFRQLIFIILNYFIENAKVENGIKITTSSDRNSTVVAISGEIDNQQELESYIDIAMEMAEQLGAKLDTVSNNTVNLIFKSI